jgi:hypothetical protein
MGDTKTGDTKPIIWIKKDKKEIIYGAKRKAG